MRMLTRCCLKIQAVFPGFVGSAVIGATLVAPRIAFGDMDLRELEPSLHDETVACHELTGAERDECLANLVLRHADPRPCQTAPDGQCGELVARIAMPECAEKYESDARFMCELQIAAELQSPSACEHATSKEACIGAVAEQRKDPNIIVEHTQPGRTRDILLSSYVVSARDLAGLDLIEDNFTHDTAAGYAAIGLGYGEDTYLDAEEYCSRLRGGYTGDSSGDEDMVERWCDQTVAVSNWMLHREQTAETDPERESIIEDLETMLREMTEANLRRMDEEFHGTADADETGDILDALMGTWTGTFHRHDNKQSGPLSTYFRRTADGGFEGWHYNESFVMQDLKVTPSQITFWHSYGKCKTYHTITVIDGPRHVGRSTYRVVCPEGTRTADVEYTASD